MQISDLVGQYSRNVANGTEELHGAQSVQKLVSTIGDLSAGSIFEGTINSVRGGKVTLALGNGQTITARLDGKMDLQQGSSMFFQVRANDGQTIAIRPYTELGNVSNPILLNALSAAQVPATDRTLVMVDTMMQEQMSIGRQSILDMAKLVGANPDANVQTIVQMTKLGLPVTEEMAAQFENYLSDRQALVGEMDLAAGHMMELLSDEALSPETAFSLYEKMLDIFMPGAEAADAGVTAAAGQESSAAEAGAGVIAEAVGQENAATVAEAEAGAPTAAEPGNRSGIGSSGEGRCRFDHGDSGTGRSGRSRDRGRSDRGTDIWKDGRDSGDSRGTVVEGADRASGKNASEHSGSDWQRGDFCRRRAGGSLCGYALGRRSGGGETDGAGGSGAGAAGLE